MCGAWVNTRKCSSASLGSGTARKRASFAFSAAASRKPKMDWAEAGTDAVPLTRDDKKQSRTREARRRTENSLMRLRRESKYVNTAVLRYTHEGGAKEV